MMLMTFRTKEKQSRNGHWMLTGKVVVVVTINAYPPLQHADN